MCASGVNLAPLFPGMESNTTHSTHSASHARLCEIFDQFTCANATIVPLAARHLCLCAPGLMPNLQERHDFSGENGSSQLSNSL